MSEKWEELYTIDQIQNIQAIELMNLRVLIDVCAKLNIDFFMYGGSLIGTVRHQGFIPWDDDLDVAMMREDYEKFIKSAPQLIPKNYSLQSPYTDKKSPYFYSKLRLNGTHCIGYDHHKLKIAQGIYVDIYPIDNMPDNDAAYLAEHKKYQRWIQRFYFRQSGPYLAYHKENKYEMARFIYRNLKWIGLKMIPHCFFVRKIDNILKGSNQYETNRFGNYFYPKPVNLINQVFPLRNAKFEGIDVKIPFSYEQHLRSRYGDYTKMPPESERIGHKQFLLDFGKYKDIHKNNQ